MRKIVFTLLLFSCTAGTAGCEYNFIGPTINNQNTSTNTNTNENKVDLHDIVNFVPSPSPTTPVPAPGGGIETPLPLPTNAQAIAQGVATANPVLLAQSCPATLGEPGWRFMDLVIKTLQALDPRWGYFTKTAGNISQDVIAYRATSDNTGVWGVDIIVDLCGQSKFAWQVLGFDSSIVWAAVRNGS